MRSAQRVQVPTCLLEYRFDHAIEDVKRRFALEFGQLAAQLEEKKKAQVILDKQCNSGVRRLYCLPVCRPEFWNPSKRASSLPMRSS